MTRADRLISRRDLAGHDAGRIHRAHLARLGETSIDPVPDGYPQGVWVTSCGITLGLYGIVLHDIGPTCRACKAAER